MKLAGIKIAEIPIMRPFHAHNTNTFSSELNKKLSIVKANSMP